MERVTEEESIVRYTAPLKIKDKKGQCILDDQKVPSEIRIKIRRGDISYEESNKVQDLLNCVLPPREWEEDGELWMQQVSPEPVTRDDLVNLKLLIEEKLKAMKALEKGTDPVRRHIYGQMMDELIRQEVVMNPERGILLLKIRDELKMTLEANRALFENGKLYGSWKATKAVESQEALINQHNHCLKARDVALAEVNVCKEQYKEAYRLSLEAAQRYDEVCIYELNNLNVIANNLKKQLREIVAAMYWR